MSDPKESPENSENSLSIRESLLSTKQNKVESILKSLENRREKGLECFFQVVVDSVTVTPRTDNLDYFWEFLEYLNPESETLEILCYKGLSYRNTRHHIPLDQPIEDKMSREEFDRKVEEKVKKWKKEQKFEMTLKENTKLKAKNKRLKKENQELRGAVEYLRNNNFDRDNLAVAQLLKELIVIYPKLLKKFPQLKAFNGLFGLEIPEISEKSESSKDTPPDPELEDPSVTFEPIPED